MSSKFDRLIFLMNVVVQEGLEEQIDLSLLDNLIEECEYQLDRLPMNNEEM